MNPLILLVTGVFAGGGLVTLLWISFFFVYQFSEKRKQVHSIALLTELNALCAQGHTCVESGADSEIGISDSSLSLSSVCKSLREKIGNYALFFDSYQIRYFESLVSYFTLFIPKLSKNSLPLYALEKDTSLQSPLSDNSLDVLLEENADCIQNENKWESEPLCKDAEPMQETIKISTQQEPENGNFEPENHSETESGYFEMESLKVNDDEALFEISDRLPPMPEMAENGKNSNKIAAKELLVETVPIPKKSIIQSVSISMVADFPPQKNIEDVLPLESEDKAREEKFELPVQALKKAEELPKTESQTEEITFEVPLFKSEDAAKILLQKKKTNPPLDLESLLMQGQTVSFDRSMLAHGPVIIPVGDKEYEFSKGQKPYVVPDHLAPATAVRISTESIQINVAQKITKEDTKTENGFISGDDVANTFDSLFDLGKSPDKD